MIATCHLSLPSEQRAPSSRGHPEEEFGHNTFRPYTHEYQEVQRRGQTSHSTETQAERALATVDPGLCVGLRMG